MNVYAGICMILLLALSGCASSFDDCVNYCMEYDTNAQVPREYNCVNPQQGENLVSCLSNRRDEAMEICYQRCSQ